MSEPTAEADNAGPDAPKEWLPTPETYHKIINHTASVDTNLAIAQLAQAGAIRAKAQVFIRGREVTADAEVPKDFWCAADREALTQNWSTGDFETWAGHDHLRAIGVSFHLGDLRKAFPEVFKGDLVVPPTPESSSGKSGRLPAEWWDDLWVEICRCLYVGDLKPRKQADIEKAMNAWIISKGESAAISTVRMRARKLWQAISRDGAD